MPQSDASYHPNISKSDSGSILSYDFCLAFPIAHDARFDCFSKKISPAIVLQVLLTV
jgi:hypothetical protein